MPRVSGALVLSVALLLPLALVLTVAVEPALARHGAPPASPGVLEAFDDLQALVRATPPAALTRGQRTSLLVKLAAAEAAYRCGHPCVALHVLGAYLHETQALRRGPRAATAEALYAHGRVLGHDVAGTLPEGARCHGHDEPDRAADVTVLESDNRHVRGRITFGPPRLLPVLGDGETFTQVSIAGTLPVGPPGLPGVPVVRRLVAFPRGADVSVLAGPPVVAETLRLNLYPFQPEPADQSSDPVPDPFGDRPFARDAAAYATPGPAPSALCTVRPLGQIRDLPIAQLECAAGQYDPVADRVTLFRALEFEVRFGGAAASSSRAPRWARSSRRPRATSAP